MFDFFRDLRKSDEDKSQEAIAAYLDGYLTPSERRRFEEKLAADPGLRHEVEQQSLIKKNLKQLPQVSAPRNFTLDPALYGVPEPDSAIRLYPILRTATVLVSIFFVIAVGAALLIPQGGSMESMALAPMAGEIVGDAQNVIPEAEQKFMEVPLEEAAAPIVETEVLAEEEVVSEAEMAVEAPAEEAPAPAEDLVVGTPSAETAIDATMEVELGIDETMEQEAVAEEAITEGELEESDSGLIPAAPITTEERQMTEEAARAGGIDTEPALETPVVETPGEEVLEAEAPPAEPLPTASALTRAPMPSATSPALAEVEPSRSAEGTAVDRAEVQEEVPAEEQPAIDQDAGLDFGRTIFSLLTILVVILGMAVIVLSAATLLVRRKM